MEHIVIARRRCGPQIEQFAELLAEGVAPQDAAEQMGLRRGYGQNLLCKIRKRLGPQAV
jgi:hypothetical protein